MTDEQKQALITVAKMLTSEPYAMEEFLYDEFHGQDIANELWKLAGYSLGEYNDFPRSERYYQAISTYPFEFKITLAAISEITRQQIQMTRIMLDKEFLREL